MKPQLIKTDYHSLIWEFRGFKVMLDFDLASLYGVETKRLKERVRRNIKRFPNDFMFVLNGEEFKFLRTQIATSKRGGTRYTPMAFTEQGVAMLSTVLNSERAIQVNIEIMRAFARYRGLLKDNEKLKSETKTLDKKINKIFKFLLARIDELHQNKKELSGRRIGFRFKGDE